MENLVNCAGNNKAPGLEASLIGHHDREAIAHEWAEGGLVIQEGCGT